MNRRLTIALLGALLIITGCTSDEGSEPDAEAAFKAMPHAKIPKVESNLSVDSIDRCVRDEPLDPSEVTPAADPIDWVATQVEEIRGLDFSVTGDINLADKAEFTKLVNKQQEDVHKKQKEASRALAWAFGLVPHGVDLNYFLRGNGAELIAGFYDPKTKEIVVRSKDKLGSKGLIVLSHELTHAATDEVLGIPKFDTTHIMDDEVLAARSVAEGDASLVELRFVSRFVPPKVTKKVIKPHVDYGDEYKKERSFGIPHLLIDDFVFPYQWGLAFVCSVFNAKGWEGVNRLYEHPPTSTGQIMFPKRYLRDEEPGNPAELSELEKPWELQTESAFGPAQLKAMFEAPGDLGQHALNEPLARAGSLSAGTYRVWVDYEAEDDSSVTAISMVERKETPGLLCASLNKWYKKTFFDAKGELVADRVMSYEDEDQNARISCQGSDVRMVIGPNADVVEQAIN